MHNVKHPTTSVVDVKATLNLEKLCLQRRQQEDMSDEAASMVADLLTKTPMLYTLWNYRRDILSSRHSTDNELTLLIREHHITSKALEQNPKIYPVWEHRFFIFTRLSELADTPEMHAKLLDEEKLFLAAKLREDPKNFHTWNYYRKVFGTVDLSIIYSFLHCDYSNHSALHQLSLELHRLYAQKATTKDNGPFTAAMKDCLDFLQLSLLLNPNAESLWQFLLKITDILPQKTLQQLMDDVIGSLEQEECSFIIDNGEGHASTVRQIDDVYVKPLALYLLLASERCITIDVEKCKKYAEYCIHHDNIKRSMYTILLKTILD